MTPTTDYIALSGSEAAMPLSSSPTTIIAYVEVEALSDASNDPNETVTITLGSGTGYTLAAEDEATLIIIDSNMPFVSVEAINDGEEGGDDGLFRFTRTGDTSQTLTVYYTIGGDAIGEDDEDYEELDGSVTFAAYSSTGDVTVVVVDDANDEPNELVSLAIDADSAYWIDSGSAVVVIIDDDLPLDIYDVGQAPDRHSIADAFLVEVKVWDSGGEQPAGGPEFELVSRFLTHAIPDAKTLLRDRPGIFTLQPGEGVELPIALFHPSWKPRPALKPGTYTIRATVSYAEAPSGETRSVTSEPVTVTVTEEHIKAAEAYRAALRK